MATKKECDRCSKQWNYGDSNETCAIAVTIPYWQQPNRDLMNDGNYYRSKVEKSYELCQACARTVYIVLIRKDAV